MEGQDQVEHLYNNKGNPLLIYRHYGYCKDAAGYSCRNSTSYSCPATLTLAEGNVTIVTHAHNHPPIDDPQLAVIRVTSQFRQPNPDMSSEPMSDQLQMEELFDYDFVRGGVGSWWELEDRFTDDYLMDEETKRKANLKYRYGNRRQCFNYILLDPRRTMNLRRRSKTMTIAQLWRIFLSAIFYIGKATEGTERPFDHLDDAFKDLCRNPDKRDNPKLATIQDIWRDGHGVIVYQGFHNALSEEAHTREAAMIDVIGRGPGKLSNKNRGSYYGMAKYSWTPDEQRHYGYLLLYRAFKEFLGQVETPITPGDLGVATTLQRYTSGEVYTAGEAPPTARESIVPTFEEIAEVRRHKISLAKAEKNVSLKRTATSFSNQKIALPQTVDAPSTSTPNNSPGTIAKEMDLANTDELETEALPALDKVIMITKVPDCHNVKNPQSAAKGELMRKEMAFGDYDKVPKVTKFLDENSSGTQEVIGMTVTASASSFHEQMQRPQGETSKVQMGAKRSKLSRAFWTGPSTAVPPILIRKSSSDPTANVQNYKIVNPQ